MKSLKYYLLINIIIFSLTMSSCKKEPNVSLPAVITYTPESVSSTIIIVGYKVESDGGGKISDCGIYIGDAPSPETLGNQIQIAKDTGTFYVQLNGLSANTLYYMKAYAINSKGQALGDQVTFTTPPAIKDFDNNSYETVIINNQVWMASNLQTTHYMNGELISTTTTPASDISGESAPRYQWSYPGDDTNTAVYGKLYTYYTVTDSRKICPTGWHIPTDADWITLENNLGGANFAASFLKETGTVHWSAPYNTDANNITLFKALPGGYRNTTGTFFYLKDYGFWWSSTLGDISNVWVRSMFTQSTQVSRLSFAVRFGASVRCVKD
jgi:uncharacterized protein (TIGR02145 family)